MRRALLLTVCLFLGACRAQPSAPVGDRATRVAAGAETYRASCAVCHGAQARGDGPLAGDLDVAPSDLTRVAARNGGVFSYAQVMARIHGYPGQFDVMPEFGPLFAGPTVAWRDPETGKVIETPRALLAVATYLDSIQRG